MPYLSGGNYQANTISQLFYLHSYHPHPYHPHPYHPQAAGFLRQQARACLCSMPLAALLLALLLVVCLHLHLGLLVLHLVLSSGMKPCSPGCDTSEHVPTPRTPRVRPAPVLAYDRRREQLAAVAQDVKVLRPEAHNRGEVRWHKTGRGCGQTECGASCPEQEGQWDDIDDEEADAVATCTVAGKA